MLFVTTDPHRDTPPVLRRYLHRFDPSFVGLTGDWTGWSDSAGDGRRDRPGPELPSGGYDVTHGTQILGRRPTARPRRLDGGNRAPRP